MTDSGTDLEQRLEHAERGLLSEQEQAELERDAEYRVHRVLERVGSRWREDARVEQGYDYLAANALALAATGSTTRRPRLMRQSARIALVFLAFAGSAWAIAARLQSHGEIPARTPSASAPAPSAHSTLPRVRATQALVPEHAPSSTPAAITSARPVVSAAELASASELLRRAGAARAAGDLRRAVVLYRQLGQRFPASAEDRVARVALGRILLDSFGDASGALREFDQYLTRSGSLREEAMLGRARALGRLGRTEAELSAWRELLAAYPRSVQASRARVRIATLAGGPAVKSTRPAENR